MPSYRAPTLSLRQMERIYDTCLEKEKERKHDLRVLVILGEAKLALEMQMIERRELARRYANRRQPANVADQQ